MNIRSQLKSKSTYYKYDLAETLMHIMQPTFDCLGLSENQ